MRALCGLIYVSWRCAGRLANGGSVYLPAGNYQIENIAVPSNVDVFGDSRSRTFCHTPSASKPMFVVINSMNVSGPGQEVLGLAAESLSLPRALWLTH